MSGFNLNEGEYEKRKASEDELWASLTCIFSSRSYNTTSYKFGFFKAIIDNLYSVDEKLSLSFDQLFSKFSEIYWNLVLRYNLRQSTFNGINQQSAIEKTLKNYENANPGISNVPYESLKADLQKQITKDIKKLCKRYVVGALYEDTSHLFYSFSKKEEWITINPLMYEFLCKHKIMIEKINYFEWARFLEKVNDEKFTSRLLSKIDESSKRNDLSLYRQILYDEFEEHNCFYCGKKLSKDSAHVDHFIPWSFIKNDNIWNFVLACPNCNTKKNDKLPNERFLEKLNTRNRSFLLDNSKYDYDSKILNSVYKWAFFNGFDKIWNPVIK